jgi:hypothetical protein
MSKVCHTCPLWMSVAGKNPNTGEDTNDWRCALQWIPFLLIESAMQTRGAAAATEDARNRIVEALADMTVAAIAGRGKDAKLIEG